MRDIESYTPSIIVIEVLFLAPLEEWQKKILFLKSVIVKMVDHSCRNLKSLDCGLKGRLFVSKKSRNFLSFWFVTCVINNVHNTKYFCLFIYSNKNVLPNFIRVAFERRTKCLIFFYWNYWTIECAVYFWLDLCFVNGRFLFWICLLVKYWVVFFSLTFVVYNWCKL